MMSSSTTAPFDTGTDPANSLRTGTIGEHRWHAPKPCPWCSGFGVQVHHTGVCPRVRAIEYYPDGTVKRVEFWPEGRGSAEADSRVRARVSLAPVERTESDGGDVTTTIGCAVTPGWERERSTDTTRVPPDCQWSLTRA